MLSVVKLRFEPFCPGRPRAPEGHPVVEQQVKDVEGIGGHVPIPALRQSGFRTSGGASRVGDAGQRPRR